MIFQGYDWNLRAPVLKEVPNEPIHVFIRSILEGSAWRDRPEELVDRLVRLRKTLLEQAVVVPSILEEEEPIVDAEEADEEE